MAYPDGPTHGLVQELDAVQTRIEALGADIARLQRTETQALRDSLATERSSPARIRAMAARDQIEAERIELWGLRQRQAVLQQILAAYPPDPTPPEPSWRDRPPVVRVATRLARRLSATPLLALGRAAVQRCAGEHALQTLAPLWGPQWRLRVGAGTVFLILGAATLTIELFTVAYSEPTPPPAVAELRAPRIVQPELSAPKLSDLPTITPPDVPEPPDIAVPDISAPSVPDLSTVAERIGLAQPQPLPAEARAYRAQFGHSIDDDLPDNESDVEAWLTSWRAAYDRGEPWATRLIATP